MLRVAPQLGHPGIPSPRDHKKQHLRGCSALSQFTQTSTLLDWPPYASWTGLLIEALAVCTADMVGPTHCLIDLTEALQQMVD